MSGVRFDVVFQGVLVPGSDPDEVADRLARMFGLDKEAAERLLSSRRAVLKKGVSAEAAETYANALKKAGVEVSIEPLIEEGEAVLPLQSVSREASEGHDNTIGGGERTDRPEERQRLPFSFHGTGGEYFRIWIVNMLLSILTLGIYSAWAKVRRKRYFYMNTHLDKRGFAYLADPVKILIGRIVVVIVFAIYSFAGSLHPFLSIGFSIVFLFFFPWILVRSLAFNARNSSYRNIRFAFHGTVWGAAKVYILLPFLSLFTLGLLWPYTLYCQHRYVISGGAYGGSRFSFHAGARGYYRMFASIVLPMLAALGLAAGLAFLFVFMMDTVLIKSGLIAMVPLLLFVFMATFYLFFMAWYAVKTTNIFYSAARLRSHCLEANLKVLAYLRILFVNTLLTMLTLGFYHPWAKVRIVRYKAEKMAFISAGSLDVFVAGEENRVASLGEEAADFLDFDFGF
ncbi:DUF898 family protein [Desulfobotulus sp. H1]|uniref:DUF898 family protein n=1 Tax=Desulfobotulus pelophilus TaxID=2823377 RepID=A0ABT3N5C2_9BACT|nr:DUF898 family protein [Desulfobotulus pelophilus]MCW7752652.1 DUF898 family protein [Desulfobotulus pelophilus]